MRNSAGRQLNQRKGAWIDAYDKGEALNVGYSAPKPNGRRLPSGPDHQEKQYMPNVRDLPVEDLTPGNFAPFGTVIPPMADGTAFGPQDAALYFGAGTPRFYAMRLPNRGLEITRITRHRSVTQILASAGGQSWLLAVAPPPAIDTTDAEPPLEAIRAFRIPDDVAIMLF